MASSRPSTNLDPEARTFVPGETCLEPTGAPFSPKTAAAYGDFPMSEEFTNSLTLEVQTRGMEVWSDVKDVLTIRDDALCLHEQPSQDMSSATYYQVKFQFVSEFDVRDTTYLILRHTDGMKITINGKYLDMSNRKFANAGPGLLLDHTITSIISIPITQDLIFDGINELIINFPVSSPTLIGRVFLLGDFKVVSIPGAPKESLMRTKISRCGNGLPSPALDLTDITTQSLPFYVGDLSLNCSIRLDKPSRVVLSVLNFASNMAKKGDITWQPQPVDPGVVDGGRQIIGITAHSQSLAWKDGYIVRPVSIMEFPKVCIMGPDTEDSKSVASLDTRSPSPHPPVPMKRGEDGEFMRQWKSRELFYPFKGSEFHLSFNLVPITPGDSSNGPVLIPSGSIPNASSPPSRSAPLSTISRLADLEPGEYCYGALQKEMLSKLNLSSLVCLPDSRGRNLLSNIITARFQVIRLWDSLNIPDDERGDFGSRGWTRIDNAVLHRVNRKIYDLYLAWVRVNKGLLSVPVAPYPEAPKGLELTSAEWCPVIPFDKEKNGKCSVCRSKRWEKYRVTNPKNGGEAGHSRAGLGKDLTSNEQEQNHGTQPPSSRSGTPTNSEATALGTFVNNIQHAENVVNIQHAYTAVNIQQAGNVDMTPQGQGKGKRRADTPKRRA